MLQVKVKSLSRVWLFATVAYQAPPSMEFSRQEYWSGCHFLLQRIFLTWGSNPGLLHYRQTLYHLSHQKNGVNDLICKAELETQNREQMYGYQGGKAKCMDTKDELGDCDWYIYTIGTVYKIDNEWEPTAELRELYSVLYGDLNGKEIQHRGDTCIHTADSLCCTEINTTL